MAFSETELVAHKKAMDAFLARNRPEERIRDQVDLGYRMKGQSLEIFEIRPRRGEASERMECPVAKATYVRTRKLWKVFWRRADLKWHSYPPVPKVKKLSDFIALVESDAHGCFWG